MRKFVMKIVTVALCLGLTLGFALPVQAGTQWVYPPGIDYASLQLVPGMTGPNGEAVYYEPGTGQYYYFIYQQPVQPQPQQQTVYPSGSIPVGSSSSSSSSSYTGNKLFDEADKKAKELKDYATGIKYKVTVADQTKADTIVQKSLHFTNKSGRNYLDVFMEVENTGSKFVTRYWVGNTCYTLDEIKTALRDWKDR